MVNLAMNSIAVGASVWWWRLVCSKRSKSVSTVVVSNLLHELLGLWMLILQETGQGLRTWLWWWNNHFSLSAASLEFLIFWHLFFKVFGVTLSTNLGQISNVKQMNPILYNNVFASYPMRSPISSTVAIKVHLTKKSFVVCGFNGNNFGVLKRISCSQFFLFSLSFKLMFSL
jgi:hypothetical protein